MTYPCCTEGLCPQHEQQAQVDKAHMKKGVRLRRQWGAGNLVDYDGWRESGVTSRGQNPRTDYHNPTADSACARAMNLEDWTEWLEETVLKVRRRNGDIEEGQTA